MYPFATVVAFHFQCTMYVSRPTWQNHESLFRLVIQTNCCTEFYINYFQNVHRTNIISCVTSTADM